MQLTSFGSYHVSVLVVIGFAIAGWLFPFNSPINYGKLKKSVSNIEIGPRLNWFLMELPNLIWAFYFVFVKGNPITIGYALFILHYINRDIVYPLMMKTNTKVPIEVTLSAALFTTANGYLQGICNQSAHHFKSGNFLIKILGIAVFFIGFYINLKSDSILRKAKHKLIQNQQK